MLVWNLVVKVSPPGVKKLDILGTGDCRASSSIWSLDRDVLWREREGGPVLQSSLIPNFGEWAEIDSQDPSTPFYKPWLP